MTPDRIGTADESVLILIRSALFGRSRRYPGTPIVTRPVAIRMNGSAPIAAGVVSSLIATRKRRMASAKGMMRSGYDSALSLLGADIAPVIDLPGLPATD